MNLKPWPQTSTCPTCESHATKINLGTYFIRLLVYNTYMYDIKICMMCDINEVKKFSIRLHPDHKMTLSFSTTQVILCEISWNINMNIMYRPQSLNSTPQVRVVQRLCWMAASVCQKSKRIQQTAKLWSQKWQLWFVRRLKLWHI